MGRPLRTFTFSLASSLSNVKLSSIAGVHSGDRLVHATCRDDVGSTLIIHCGNGTNTVILSLGASLPHFGSIGGSHGLPIEWGTGVDDALYLTTGGTVEDCTITVISDNY